MDDRVVSTFPSPPSEYYSCYTEENVRNGSAPNPPPVIEGSYEIYGMKFDVSDHDSSNLQQTKSAFDSKKYQTLFGLGTIIAAFMLYRIFKALHKFILLI